MSKVDHLDNITSYLSRNALRFPDKPAILHPQTISFKELDKEVDRFAAGLENHGITKGSRTILLVSAGPDFFVLCFALLRIGAVPIMIDPGMGTRAMIKALSNSDANAFIGVPKAHLLKYFYPDAFKKVNTWINTGNIRIPGSVKYSSLRTEVDFPGPQCHIEPNDVAGIFFTSGSTGPPKGVIYHAKTMNAQVKLMEDHFKYGPDEIDLCTFPLLGLFVTCLGSSLVIADMDPLKPAELIPKKLINNINEYKCTQMFGSPMILNRLVSFSKNQTIKMNSLKRVISAGAPVPLELIDSFLKLIAPSATLHTPYGATEALPVSDITSTELLDQNEEEAAYSQGICIGYPLPGISIKIINIIDDPIPEWSNQIIAQKNEIGEIVVIGSSVTSEYHNNQYANSMAKIPDHSDNSIWHRMGDLGRQDSKGILWFYGRKNHRVVGSGRILYTIPVEAVFNRHPDVYRSALVGVTLLGKHHQEAVICIQTRTKNKGFYLEKLKRDLLVMASENELTYDIKHILFHPDFPVDPRHNAKIFREKLAKWAERRIR